MSLKTTIRNTQDIIDDSGYYIHSCGKILLRVESNANLNGINCWCDKCHMEVRLRKVVNGRIVNGEVKVIYNAG